MHFPFTPNHVTLISGCYPPAPLTSGPEYHPNSQELSRLTYYASNRPGKINKVASELEKRVRADCRKAQAGNTRARATLLITLYIFKALATECRRDISLLTASLIAAVDVTLTALSTDLEVAARAATIFAAWTTYTDGHLIGVDRDVAQNYISCLRQFAAMGKKFIDDRENRNRTRLVGLGSLTAAVHSEALYHSSSHFNLQVSTIVPALLATLLEVDVDTLNHELSTLPHVLPACKAQYSRASAIAEQPRFALMDDFRTRPAMDRRAASIHIHVDGDKGPSSAEVVNASLHALSSLFGHASGNQAGLIMSAALAFLDDSGGWDKVDNCRWIAAKAAEWTQYQYRYAVPTKLVEYLVEGQDAPEPTVRHGTLAIMITTVFTSPTPLINLSTSDMVSNIVALIFRRVNINPEDPLSSSLVDCVASLGTHVYYADQIQDLACELISRIVLVETNGVPGAGKANADKARSQALRYLLAGLLGLMRAADDHSASKEDLTAMKQDDEPAGTSAELPSISQPVARDVHIRPTRRTKVAPEVWHDTLGLLCDKDYAVRADYAVALISYLQKEIPKLGDHSDGDGLKQLRPLTHGPSEQVSTMSATLYGDTTTRFLNALNGYLYVLATTSSLDFHSSSSTTNGNGSVIQDGSTHDADQPRRSMALPPRPRKTSFILRALQNFSPKAAPSTTPAASLSDYGNITAILSAVHENLPIRGLLTGVPMLLALGNLATDEDPSSVLIPFVLQVVARTWAVLGRVWNCLDIVSSADKVLSSIPPSLLLPSLPDELPGRFYPPLRPEPLPAAIPSGKIEAELDSQQLLNALATSAAPKTIGLDQAALVQRLSVPWSAEAAFKDSVETNYDTLHPDGLSPLIKVAPALMQIENLSLQSLARSTRGVGVTDLRDALEGRSSISNPNLANKAPSISTLDHTSSVAHADQHHKLVPTRSRPQQRSKLAGPGEVRDVLNKLGIGKPNGPSTLKPSFPALKTEQRMPSLTPPYKA